jgi:hypothetical protein
MTTELQDALGSLIDEVEDNTKLVLVKQVCKCGMI